MSVVIIAAIFGIIFYRSFAKKRPPLLLPDTLGQGARLTVEQFTAWKDAGRALGFEDRSSAYRLQLAGTIRGIDVVIDAYDTSAPEIRAVHSDIPGRFSLTFHGEGFGASIGKALGNVDVRMKPDEESEFDARFVVSTSSVVLARKIMAKHTDALTPFDDCTWAMKGGACTVQSTTDSADIVAKLVHLVADLVVSAGSIPKNWSKLAGELGGEMEDTLDIWTSRGQLPRIRLQRTGEPLHLARDFERDCLFLTPVPRSEEVHRTLAAAGHTVDQAIAAIRLPPTLKVAKIEEAMSALLATRSNEGIPYR